LEEGSGALIGPDGVSAVGAEDDPAEEAGAEGDDGAGAAGVRLELPGASPV
jgi:hypothetical protein